MTPDDYVLHFKIDREDDCVIGIVPDNVDTGYTIGQVFLKAFYTVFDRDNNRVGFVRANPHPGSYEKSEPSPFTHNLSLKDAMRNGPVSEYRQMDAEPSFNNNDDKEYGFNDQNLNSLFNNNNVFKS